MKKIIIGMLVMMCCFSTTTYAEFAYCQGEGGLGGHQGRGKGRQQQMHGNGGRGFKSWLEKEMPEFSKEVEALKKENSGLCQSFMKEFSSDKHLRYMFRKKNVSEEIKNTAKELIKNEFQSFKLAGEYVKSKDEALLGQIETVLNRSFELKEQLQLGMIKRMEERIVSVREMIAKRKELKEQLVRDRIETLTSNQDVLKW